MIACLLSLLVGCGSGTSTMVPVKGKLTISGEKLGMAGVSFRADESKGNQTKHIPAATTDGSGMYELTTGGEKGAPAGWYKVVITPPSPPITGGELPQTGPPPFDQKYLTPDTTDLSIEVKAGAAAGAYDLNLTK